MKILTKDWDTEWVFAPAIVLKDASFWIILIKRTN